MKVKKLKYMRKNYSVVRMKDPTVDGKEVFRLLKKGQVVAYAWIPVHNIQDPNQINDFRILIVGQALNLNWEYLYYGNDKVTSIKESIESVKREKRRIFLEKKRQSIASKTKPVWP